MKIKELIIVLLVLLSWTPYLFLFTSVEEVKDSDRAYRCHLQSYGEIHKTIGFGSVYYFPLGRSPLEKNHSIILPYFFRHGEVKYAKCGAIQIPIGSVPEIITGDQVRITTTIHELKLFGYTFHSETNWSSFGNDTTPKKDFKEGEKILTKLVDDKEVDFFEGKRVSK